MKKTIQIDEKDFKKLIDKINELENEIDELRKANAFLNNQIEEYNKKFAKKDK